MAAIDDWRAAADQISNQKKNDYINSNQYVLDSINSQKDAELQGLANSNTSAINALNQNKEEVNKTALDNAKQANINRLLALKDNRSAMNRAGLGTQGVVGSQVNSINNNYGTNLNTILKDKANGIRDINNQINDTNLQYETNKANLAAQYAQMYANKQSEIQSTALQLGQDAYNNYIAQQQAAAELEFQRQQQEEANRLAWAQLRAQQASNYSFSNSDSNYQVNTAYYQGDLNPDAQYGTFNNDYQPNNVNGQKLSKTGNTITFNTQTLSGQRQTVTQNIWKAGGKYYYWDGRYNRYIQCTKKGKPV
jgi:hypothetical protein